MNSKLCVVFAILTLKLKTNLCDDKCISESHSDAGGEAFNICLTGRDVKLLTCSGENKLVIMDVVQRIKRMQCTQDQDCCQTKDSDRFKDSVNCEKTNPMFMKTLGEIMIKCNGKKFCTFLEPKSSIWSSILQGKHANASHLKISYKCDNWPRYEMCGNVSREVSLPFYISGSSQSHLNCSCDIYTENPGIFYLYVMELILGSDRESTLTIGNSTHKYDFNGGQDTIVLNRKLGSWSKVSVALVTYKRKQPVNILIKVKGSAKNVQIECHGVKSEPDFTDSPASGKKNGEITRQHPGVLFACGFYAACFAIGLTIGCVAIIKRRSSESSAVTYTVHMKTANRTGNGSSDLYSNANDFVMPGPSRQDGGAERNDKDEDPEHLYSLPSRLSGGSFSTQRGSVFSDKISVNKNCEDSPYQQQNVYDVASFPKAPPRTKGKGRYKKVPEESSESESLETRDTVDVDEVEVVEL